jgi:hypothetical protein
MTTRKPSFFRGATPLFGVAALVSLLAAVPNSSLVDESDREPSPRELYNDGTRKLNEGRLNEAESYLNDAVASQNERIQPSALYNLGLTRFQQGVNELTNAPEPRALDSKSSSAGGNAAAAIHTIDDALTNDDTQAMVAAYLRGRGARRELKSAIAAVQQAMDTFGVVLTKWRRASGDFHSTVELRSSDTDAQTNADLTDRYIAKLVDQLTIMMQRMGSLQQQREELRKKMGMLKGKIPDQSGPPMLGDDGDDDEDEGKKPPKQPELEERDGPVKSGREMQWTLEEARQLLNQLQLDKDRQLYLSGSDENEKPRDRRGRDW